MRKKKCEDGKNCGATCIARGIRCLIDLSQPLSSGLSRVSKKVKGLLPSIKNKYSKDTLKLKGSAYAREFMAEYEKQLKSAIAQEERANNSSFLEKSRALSEQIEIMRRIKEKLLKTNLREDEVKNIVNGINIIPYLDRGSTIERRRFGTAKVRRIEYGVKDQVEEFVRLFNGRGFLEKVNGVPTPTVRTIEIHPLERGFAWFSKNLAKTDGKALTTFHELGHFVEHQSKVLSSYSDRWRRDKALTSRQLRSLGKNDPLYELVYKDGKLSDRLIGSTLAFKRPAFWLRDMTNNGNYGENEVALAGRYMDPYMGKVYTRLSNTTEVLSMALQSFSTPKDMVNLYKNHPDLFEMAVGLAITPAGN